MAVVESSQAGLGATCWGLPLMVSNRLHFSLLACSLPPPEVMQLLCRRHPAGFTAGRETDLHVVRVELTSARFW